jgi:hypothetical protein
MSSHIALDRTTNATDTTTLDSFAYCLAFWEGALDDEDEIDHFIRESQPRHVRAADDVA